MALLENMRFYRRINIHTEDVPRFTDFVSQREMSLHVEWETTIMSGSGIAGRIKIPIVGKGTVSGQLSEEDATALNGFISELEASYHRPRT